MSVVAAAVVGSAIVGAGVGIYSAKKSAKAQGDAADQAYDTEWAMYSQTREDMAPWRQAGEWALGAPSTPAIAPGSPVDLQALQAERNALAQELKGTPTIQTAATAERTLTPEEYAQKMADPVLWQGIYGPGGSPGNTINNPQTTYTPPANAKELRNRLAELDAQIAAGGTTAGSPASEGTGLVGMIERGPGEFTESPGYQWTLQQGLNAQQNALSAMGQNRSGKHIKSATQYAEGLASTEYDNFLSRWYQSLTPYQSLAGLGMTGAQTTAQAGANAAGGMANAQIYGGNAQAQGYINQSNALTGAIQGGANQLLYLNAQRNIAPSLGGGGANWGGYTGNNAYSGNYGIR